MQRDSSSVGGRAPTARPAIQPLGGVRWSVAAAAIVSAALLLLVFAARVAVQLQHAHWWVPLALVGGVLFADFCSGLVHWGADTWGRDDVPVIGPRLLVPFRVHHVNPDDFVTRAFVDTNGDVAIVAAAALAGAFAIPLDESWGQAAAVFILGFCGVGMMTNQIHQWAHRPSVPRLVRLAQRAGLILGRDAHHLHHARPYHARYCITTGWCNATLDGVGFFRRLERLMTRLTGVGPRQDDRHYEERYGKAPLKGRPT